MVSDENSKSTLEDVAKELTQEIMHLYKMSSIPTGFVINI